MALFVVLLLSRNLGAFVLAVIFVAMALAMKPLGKILVYGIPVWVVQLVLPLGFGLITYRYALFVVRDARRLWRPAPTA